jgi:Glycosyltransferase WbsX
MEFKLKIIAMYLPQFHSCRFNNEWWGEGFTEWNNVKSAKPKFDGHNQPRIPLDGYYSLDDVSAIKKQAKQAAEYGVYGFSIYHYWYEGKRPLATPLDLILKNPDIDLKFNICWANHSWTRSWKNRSGSMDVLIEQKYESDEESRKNHEDFLCEIFADKRYININEMPIFQIYNPENIADLESFISGLRRSVKNKLGKDLHISAMLTAWQPNWKYLDYFDSVTLFQPSLATFSPEEIFNKNALKVNSAGLSTFLRSSPPWIKKLLYKIQDLMPEKLIFYKYEDVWRSLLSQYAYALKSFSKTVYPMGFVNFDNTPRYNNRARIYKGYSCAKFSEYILSLVGMAKEAGNDIIFLNAWNEWGEGMYLEPDTLEGKTRLEAVKRAIDYFHG